MVGPTDQHDTVESQVCQGMVARQAGQPGSCPITPGLVVYDDPANINHPVSRIPDYLLTDVAHVAVHSAGLV